MASGRTTAWHRGPGKTRHARVFEAVKTLRRQQSGLESQWLRSLSLYEERPIGTLGPDLDHRAWADSDTVMKFDVVRSVVDTVATEILQSNPKPTLLTEAGDYKARRDAQRANRAIEGVLLEGGLYDDLKRDVVVDAGVCKAGFVEVVEDDDRVGLDRAYPWEVYVDPYDAHYGTPSRIMRVRAFEKAKLADLYPKHADVIMRGCESLELAYSVPGERSDDHVTVVKGWSLPSTGQPGVKTVCVANLTLEDDAKWEADVLPLVDYRWSTPRKGFWGASIVDQLRRPQRSLHRVHQTIDDVHRLMANPAFLIPPGFDQSQITNKVGDIITVPGIDKPGKWQGIGAPAELYAERERLLAWAYEKIGASQLAAHSEIPRGLGDSGRALNIYLDVGSKRLTMPVKGLEGFYVRLALAIVAANRRLAKKNPGYEIVYQGQGTVERIEWNSITLKDTYRWRCFPTSMLPSTPAGKMAALEQLYKEQIITKETFFRVLGVTDFQKEADLQNAPRDLIERALDDLLADDKQVLPESIWNIPLCILIGGLTYQRCRLEMGARPDESRLRKLRTFVVHATKLLDKWVEEQRKVSDAIAGPPPMPGAPPGPVLPMGLPQPGAAPALPMLPPAA